MLLWLFTVGWHNGCERLNELGGFEDAALGYFPRCYWPAKRTIRQMRHYHSTHQTCPCHQWLATQENNFHTSHLHLDTCAVHLLICFYSSLAIYTHICCNFSPGEPELFRWRHYSCRIHLSFGGLIQAQVLRVSCSSYPVFSMQYWQVECKLILSV
jgi:hypothetical protein